MTMGPPAVRALGQPPVLFDAVPPASLDGGPAIVRGLSSRQQPSGGRGTARGGEKSAVSNGRRQATANAGAGVKGTGAGEAGAGVGGRAGGNTPRVLVKRAPGTSAAPGAYDSEALVFMQRSTSAEQCTRVRGTFMNGRSCKLRCGELNAQMPQMDDLLYGVSSLALVTFASHRMSAECR